MVSTSPDIKSEIVFIPSLLNSMAQGKLRIPRFQRPFVWTPEKMLYLLDSIKSRYPIGSILLWDSDSKLQSSEIIGPQKIAPPPDGTISYVLDGQQRLSTLFGALLLEPTEDTEWLWQVWYDLETKEFIHLKNKAAQGKHFPVWSFLDTFDFLEAADKIRQCYPPSTAKTFIGEANEISDILRNCQIPVTRIQNTTLDEAVRIFGRLNSAGVKISDDQMVSALSYKELDGQSAFDLAARIDEIKETLSFYSFGNIDRVILLRVILAELELDVYRTNWENMVKTHSKLLPSAAEKCIDTLVRVIEFLQSVGVKSDALLPYSMQIVVLSGFFRICKEPSELQRALLVKWFWVSTYTGWFANGNSTTIRSAITDMVSIAGGSSERFESINIGDPANPFPSTFDFRASRVRAQLLFQLSLNPLNDKGEKIESWEEINKHGYKALRYIFNSTSHIKKSLYRSPANRILLPVSPRTRVMDILTEIPESIRTNFLDSHCISEDAFNFLINGEPENFLESRKRTLREKELKFMVDLGVARPVNESDESTIIDIGEENSF